MVEERPTPFDNIESAYQYVGLLREALDDAHASIQNDARPHSPLRVPSAGPTRYASWATSSIDCASICWPAWFCSTTCAR